MPDLPLHPAVVHLPMALSILVPLALLYTLFVVWRRGGSWGRFAPVFLLQLALLGSSIAALRTGEAEEDRVEAVVPEAAIEAHEHAAERFTRFTVGPLVLLLLGGVLSSRRAVALGLLGVATVGSLGVAAQGYAVGHAGGELVYTYNAGAAYGAGVAPSKAQDRGRHDTHEDDDHDDDDD